ncbi:protein kinase [Achlya hypogyna]|uniref:Protein kinase n=1 Tax=Achlya hypogyna TaxID=1202772 RepID=A0A1V9Y5T3_ACHHY|nr:protein kinase [Achlya hypogyna]
MEDLTETMGGAMDDSDIIDIGVRAPADMTKMSWTVGPDGIVMGTPSEEPIQWGQAAVKGLERQLGTLRCSSVAPPACGDAWRSEFHIETIRLKQALEALGNEVERRRRDLGLEDLYVKRTLGTGDMGNPMFAAYMQTLQDKYMANFHAFEAEKAHYRRQEKKVLLHSTTAFGDLPFLAQRYQLKALIGHGGNSEVWEALDTQTQALRAIKICAKVHQAEQEYYNHQMFLNSPHTVRVHGPLLCTDHRGHSFSLMVMDRMECDLYQYMENLGKPCDIAFARHLLFQLLLSLDYLHQKNMAHCDLKPANVLLETVATGQLRLTDFHLSRPKSSIILVGQNASPAFAPPEWYLLSPGEAVAQGATYEKFDIWAVGLIFYMLVCHAHPLGTQSSKSDMTLRMKAYREDPTLPMPPHLPPDAQHLLRQCLHLDWHVRPTVKELLAVVCYR